jgi:hypothetical protein
MISVTVEFLFEDIDDPNSVRADEAVELLSLGLEEAGIHCDSWHIDDVYAGQTG